jgi:hypothetical protein
LCIASTHHRAVPLSPGPSAVPLPGMSYGIA